jgi:2-methylisocitrate lyase-like PEP mutase family enzyme
VLARPGLTVAEIAEAGARRISVGGALAWTAVTAMIAAAERLRDGDCFGLAAPSRIGELLDDAGRGPSGS